MAKKLKKRLVIPVVTLALLLSGAVVWAYSYVGRASDTLSVQADRRRYSYQVTITPRKAIENQPVNIKITVRDRVTRRLAANVEFHLEMDQFHFVAQSPSAWFVQDLRTDERGVIEYRFVPTEESRSEVGLAMLFSAEPSIYIQGSGDYVNPDLDQKAYLQYSKEDSAMMTFLDVLPPLAALFRR